MRLQNKVAVITGSGMGQGRAASILFAKEGAKIVALEIDKKAGNETVDLIKQQGGEAIFIKCDVSSEREVKEGIKAGVAAFGKLNILYNNAGVMWTDKDLIVTETVEEIWDKVMGINLKGPLWVCKYGIPELIKQGSGSIINIGSSGVYKLGSKYLSAYYASKGALTTLTRAIAMQYVDKKIRANVIQPGMTDTPLQSFRDGKNKKAIAEYLPIGRWATPEEIAYCALFLATDESSYITGAEIIVDGGLNVKF
jgi:meso-butanediol dehydrogenase/(S,S)-butanediol dehydrogenase/diacetyl reductase